ncbi:MAG: FtsH protease activity modulator HflK [Myxococcota bacterium]|nr:FtsH protease activity modulator HflK [Myxococcota bacterium]
MADAPEKGSEKRVRKSITRRLFGWLLTLAALAVIGGWLSTGFYKLELGEEAIILRLGENQRTVTREGWNWHWPEPLEYDKPVNTQRQRTQFFGREGVAKDGSSDSGIFIQTADKNIVSATFELQYRIDNPYEFVYGMVEPSAILFDATQAAVRKVIGAMSIDEVLIKRKNEIESKAENILEKTMHDYFGAKEGLQPFVIEKINLQEVNPPESVLAAFAEVAAAQQDEERFVNEARGERAEIIESARAKSAELKEGSEAYRDALVLEAKGQAGRFTALLAEYERAPRVTRERLYLETMEKILPTVEKVVVEPGLVEVLPIWGQAGMGPVATPPPKPHDGRPPEEARSSGKGRDAQ